MAIDHNGVTEILIYSVCIEKIFNIPLVKKDTVVDTKVGLYNGGKKLEMTTAALIYFETWHHMERETDICFKHSKDTKVINEIKYI